MKRRCLSVRRAPRMRRPAALRRTCRVRARPGTESCFGATREAARAHDSTSQAQLGYARITSPIDGVVTDLPFYPGESAPSGAPVVSSDLSTITARTCPRGCGVAGRWQ